MTEAYSPGLTVTRHTQVRRVRELPLPGTTLVTIGTSVRASTPVLRAEIPGELEIVRIAERLGFEPQSIPAALLVKVGDLVHKGQRLCDKRYFFRLLSATLQSPVTGTVEFFTEANAHLGLRLPSSEITVDAYIDGTVVNVVPGVSVEVETVGALLQGIFGVGGERHGIVTPLQLPPDTTVTSDHLRNLELRRAILIGGKSFSEDALRFAAEKEVAGVITGSIDSATLGQFVGREIGVTMTGDEAVPFTLFITEGFGELPISTRAMELAREFAGQGGSMNGATQVRAGAVRPELIISHQRELPMVAAAHSSLTIGTRVRCTREPYFGKLGTITALPTDPERIESGAFVRVAFVALDQLHEVRIPRANIEIERS